MKKPEDYKKEAEKAAEEVYEFLKKVTGKKGFDEYLKTIRELKDCVVIFHVGEEEKERANKYIKKYMKGYAKFPIFNISLEDDADSQSLIYMLEIEKTPTIMIYEESKNTHRLEPRK